MTVFVIDIGSEYGYISLSLIKKLCDFNGINLFVLQENPKQNIYNLHPSWTKLFCHELVEDDFIICWDLDLLPIKLFDLKSFFEQTKLNFCVDWSLFDDKTANYTKSGFNHKFLYNCGLIGVPKYYQNFLKDIYTSKAHNSSYPSYEQYHVNDKIFDTQTEVNILDGRLNYFKEIIDYPEDVFCVHYTHKIRNNEERIDLIKNHFNKYKNNFYDETN